jgi:hypothetical protein
MPSKKTLVLAGAALVGGALALAAYGRAKTRAVLSADPEFADAVVDQMTFRESLTAGVRVLANRNPLGYQGTVAVTG